MATTDTTMPDDDSDPESDATEWPEMEQSSTLTFDGADPYTSAYEFLTLAESWFGEAESVEVTVQSTKPVPAVVERDADAAAETIGEEGDFESDDDGADGEDEWRYRGGRPKGSTTKLAMRDRPLLGKILYALNRAKKPVTNRNIADYINEEMPEGFEESANSVSSSMSTLRNRGWAEQAGGSLRHKDDPSTWEITETGSMALDAYEERWDEGYKILEKDTLGALSADPEDDA